MQRLSPDRKQDFVHKKDFIGKSDMGKWLTIVAAGIFVISLGFCLWIFRPTDRKIVEILSDGEIIYTFDMTKVENQEIVIFYDSHDNSDNDNGNHAHGSSNTIQIENGEIWVREAQCPDQTCVKMGKLYSESLPIVCLPNRLTIRFAE